ncbi:glyoxalase superfamily protein [Arenibaculum pallidiluteum]|uniref:glyoxalase superfamily protein n=1 Tax=Arenibaculum pallidiluteum TaxID=2812559 RepID=UPI001A963846|nr:glyoxalase superfamily protein [Arenibaculum pallidiluteum]
MTPFGARIRELRAQRGLNLKDMAEALEISSAYLSALEHGRRGQPSPQLVRQICAYFGLFWDEAEALERLAQVSHPRVTVDTSGLSPRATELANQLSERIRRLDAATVDEMLALLAEGPRRAAVRFRRAVPVVPSLDLGRSLAFYQEQLGFTVLFRTEDYAALVRGAAEFHLWRCHDPAIPRATGFRIEAAAIDSLHTACSAAGIVHPDASLGERPWGVREFAIVDPDGNLLTFFERLRR